MTASHSRHADLHGHVLRGTSRMLGGLLRGGVRLGPMMLLTVRGRTTGLPRTTPVDVFERNGRAGFILFRTLGLDGNASVPDFARAAESHPVFELAVTT